MSDVDAARADASRSSGGGVAFLLAYALTLLVVTAIALAFPARVAALAFLFQGGIALPLAFWLERRLGFPPMASDNPLRTLSIQLAMVQVVALPAAILVYEANPLYVPAAFAAVAGGHFLPYAWLHRTPAYLGLGVAASLVPFALMVALGAAGFPLVPLALAVIYAAMAALLWARFGRSRGAAPAGG